MAITLIVTAIAVYLDNILREKLLLLALETMNDLSATLASREFLYSVLILFFSPIIVIVLPAMLILPLRTIRKTMWFFGTTLIFAFTFPISLLFSLPFSTQIGEPIFMLIRIPIYGATGWLVGLALAWFQRSQLRRAHHEAFHTINQRWYSQTIKSGLISGTTLAVIALILEFLNINEYLLGLLFLLSFSLPYTLLTATPAAQLHTALNTPPPTTN